MAQRYQGGILGVGFNPLQAPNAPTIGAATAGNQTVSVAFTAPANVGGSAISTYAVRVSPGNFSATGASSPISVSGLTNDTTYTFSVAALNSYGPSPYSGTVSATPVEPLYVENVFSTYLYTGNDSTQTIANGINLAGKGGMVWLKSRSGSGTNNILQDTSRGANNVIVSNTTAAQSNISANFQFLSNGFSQNNAFTGFNSSAYTYASWTFREAPRFFDVVTFTGNGGNQTISHNLGVTPGFVIYKATSSTSSWLTLNRRDDGVYVWAVLNGTGVLGTYANASDAGLTSTTFNANPGGASSNGVQYVAYLFAHDTASDGVIKCGSFTTDVNGEATVNLGWEPQWLLAKSATSSQDWDIIDTMRGWVNGTSISTGDDPTLSPTYDFAEQTGSARGYPTATGFVFRRSASQTYVYVAIRRGPMQVPTVGTTVFSPVAITPTISQSITTNFPVDLNINTWRTGIAGKFFFDRLRGGTVTAGRDLDSTSTAAEEVVAGYGIGFDSNTELPRFDWYTGVSSIYWSFRRAPSFFDVVCYTGTGVDGRTVNHNLGVTPELMICKARNESSTDWVTYAGPINQVARGLNTTDAFMSRVYAYAFSNTGPTATTFTVSGTPLDTMSLNRSSINYVAYLFASCPGVSKVGSYTGNGSSQTINCGFTTGARFFLVKASSTTGNWWVWDSARGITAPADPALRLNGTGPEVTSADATDPDNSGIIVNQEATCSINANGVTYIFLAIS